MALHVIDRFQTVDVDEGENESPIRAAGTIDLPLQIDQATVTSKRSGQAINARLRAIAGGLPPIVCGPLTITRSVGPVAGCRCAVAARLRALTRREAAVRPVALVGRTIARLGRAVTFLGRAVTFLGRAVTFLGRAVAFVGRQAFLRHDQPVPHRPLYPAG